MVVKPTDARRPWEPFVSIRWVRAIVWAKTGGLCWYCGEQTNPFEDFACDHIKPASAYPELAEELTNIVPCCKSCNSTKSTDTIAAFRARLAQRRGWDSMVFHFEHMGWEA